MAMVVTMHIRLKVQLVFEQSLHRLVSLAGYAAIQPYARRGQSGLGAAADPSANQRVRFQSGKHTGQRAVSTSAGTS